MTGEYEELLLDKNTLQLYKDYVGITDPEELKLHLFNVQSRLVKVKKTKPQKEKKNVDNLFNKRIAIVLKEEKIHYRCIEQYKFAFSRIYHRFFYKKLIKMAQELEKPYFLDIGCCTGTDLRKLLLDGYPKDFLIGMDIEQSYIDCGYLLFKDNPTTCPIQFIVSNDNTWEPQEKMTIVHAGSVFHLFPNQDTIRQFLKRIARMLKQGGVLVGGHVCADKPTEFFRQSTQKLKYYMGINEFKQLLISEGFTDIEIETKPRLGAEEEDFTAFWISFYAIYNPNNTNTIRK